MRYDKARTAERTALIKQMFMDGVPTHDICKALGASTRTVYNHTKGLDGKQRKAAKAQYRAKEITPLGKWRAERNAKAVAMRKEGYQCRQIAHALNMSEGLVGDVMAKHGLTDPTRRGARAGKTHAVDRGRVHSDTVHAGADNPA